MKKSDSPPKFSPYGLIQECLWPNRWLILASCVLLNCTRRIQVERIMSTFIERYPTPERLIASSQIEVVDLIGCLGFKNRRSKVLFALANELVNDSYENVSNLPGVGEYAKRAYEMFVLSQIGTVPPDDGALVKYYNWFVKQNSGVQEVIL